MIEENNFGSKYGNIPINISSSWNATNRRKILKKRTDIEHSKFFDKTSRNSKTKGFRKSRAEIRAEVEFTMEEFIKVITPIT